MTKQDFIEMLYRLEARTRTSVWTISDLVEELEKEETNGL